MADEHSREHERQAAGGDPEAAAAVLRDRLRAGELTQEHVELAASLGHEVARVLHSEAEQLQWENLDQRRRAVVAAARLHGITALVRVAADWFEHVLDAWEAENPGDTRVREAIDAARTWADCPCDEHRMAPGAATLCHSSYRASHYADAAGDVLADAATDAETEHAWQRLRLAAYVLGEV